MEPTGLTVLGNSLHGFLLEFLEFLIDELPHLELGLEDDIANLAVQPIDGTLEAVLSNWGSYRFSTVLVEFV